MTMKRNTYWRNILIIKTIGRGKTYFIGKNVNITLLLIPSLFLLSSCEHVSEAELRQAANSANNDSTLWHSLQGFWRVEAIKYDLDTTFFAPEDPNFIEIHGDTILQFYLVNAPKTPVSAPNRGWFDGIWEVLRGFEGGLRGFERVWRGLKTKNSPPLQWVLWSWREFWNDSIWYLIIVYDIHYQLFTIARVVYYCHVLCLIVALWGSSVILNFFIYLCSKKNNIYAFKMQGYK